LVETFEVVMNGTDRLISKWAAQMAKLKAQAENAPGDERDGLLHRIALCQRAIETAEMLLPTKGQAASLDARKPSERSSSS
jgi:hypothetical protein